MFFGHQCGKLCGRRVQGYKTKEDLVTAVNKFSLIVAAFSPIRGDNPLKTLTPVGYLGVKFVSIK